MKKVRIQDVAAHAGVSMGSASRVLNRAANVTPEVREKVEHSMRILGYRPSHLARALRSRASLTIGCMFSDVTNPLYARTFRALEEAFRADGYMLLLANGLNDVERELEIVDTFQVRGMDGVILAPGHEQDSRLIDRINQLTVPAVLYDREMPQTRADAVLFDHQRAMRTACARLFSLGHTRIALALWSAGSRPVQHRIAGFQNAFREAGLSACDDLILRQPTATSSVFHELRKLLDAASPPTALIAQGTHILVSALQAITRTGRRIPKDFSVIGIGDSDFAEIYDPPISVLRMDSTQIARRVSSILLDRIAQMPGGGDEPPRRISVAYELIERQSIGRCRE